MDGQVAVITGGSKGLGLAMAQGLASAGAKIVVAARNGEQAAEAAKGIQDDFGVEATSLSVDVTDQSQCEAMVQHAMKTFGRIDILINSAGINIRGPIDELSSQQFQEVLNTNVHGTWLACRSVVPIMKQRKYGRIINLASTLGLVGLANRTPYASSKGAVVQMSRSPGARASSVWYRLQRDLPRTILDRDEYPDRRYGRIQ